MKSAGITVGIFGSGAGGSLFASDNRFDLVIKNGTVLDGSGNPGFKADLGIKNDRIATVGKIPKNQAVKTIDAAGKIVSPGFIDIHSHTDFHLFINPKAESKIRQGVTTELSGNCGYSEFPRKAGTEESEGIVIDWTNLEEYHSAMAKRGIALNHATLVGHGTVRRQTMGNERRVPTAAELAHMKRLIAEAMEQGAFGFSTGLEYAPGCFSRTPELIELSKVAAKYGGFYATHSRSEDSLLMEAVAEAITIAEHAGLPLQYSHLKAAGRDNYYKADMVFDLMERAVKRGVDLTADRYPYTAFATSFSINFPDWAHEGGMEALLARLQDKDIRKRMKAGTQEKVDANNSWGAIMIQGVRNEANKHLVGKRIIEAAEAMNMDPYNFSCDLMISEGGDVGIIGFGMSDENTEKILSHPLVMLCSDGYALAPYGPLSEGISHPRSYGTFPRFLGHYVREKKLVSLPEAIRKMTYMPAARMGLSDRGMIKEGTFADIVVFDAGKVRDVATYTNSERYPEGIEHVLVNGTVVIDKGEHTGELPGRTLQQ